MSAAVAAADHENENAIGHLAKVLVAPLADFAPAPKRGNIPATQALGVNCGKDYSKAMQVSRINFVTIIVCSMQNACTYALPSMGAGGLCDSLGACSIRATVWGCGGLGLGFTCWLHVQP